MGCIKGERVKEFWLVIVCVDYLDCFAGLQSNSGQGRSNDSPQAISTPSMRCFSQSRAY